MASIIWRHTAPTAETTEKLLQEKLNVPYRPEINLYAAYHAVHNESTIQSRRPLQIRP